MDMNILTINSGSSSIKFSLHVMGTGEVSAFSGVIAGIGTAAGRLHVSDPGGNVRAGEERQFSDHTEALDALMKLIGTRPEGRALGAIGHRLVHGGGAYVKPHLIDAALLSALDALIPFAPDHLPHEIAAIRAFELAYPEVAQVACFDTAFHRSMPEVAQHYALPEDVLRRGVLRYGFHGLSYEYVLSELRHTAGVEIADGKVIIAHLGNGASMGAFSRGKSMDTTMGFTPAGGLVMSTRSGDLDPGVIVYLLRDKGMDAPALNELVNKKSGLIGLSGISSDVKELLDRERENPRAAAAIELFCYQAKKFLGALAAALGGLDTLVFTGGIGENAPAVRARICNNTEFLGIHLDGERNQVNASIVSSAGSPVTVRVMKTNEELMIARHTYNLVQHA